MNKIILNEEISGFAHKFEFIWNSIFRADFTRRWWFDEGWTF